MYHLAICVTVGLLALIAGCRTDANKQLLERELRLQEDTIYELEAVIDEHRQRIESCRRENSALRQTNKAGGGNTSSDTIHDPAPETQRSPEDFVPPKIDLGPETVPTDLLPDQSQSQPGTGPRLTSISGQEQSDRVHQIKINPRLTGGNDADGRPGDEGLMVVFEPRDAKNGPLNAAGHVSLIVEDPAAAEPYVARWNFATDEVAARFRNSALGRGFQFELPWPNRPPAHENLRLRVIYSLASGRSFTADHLFKVDLMPPGSQVDPTIGQPPPDVSAAHRTPSPIAPNIALQRPAPSEAKTPPIETPPNDARQDRSALRPHWSPTRN